MVVMASSRAPRPDVEIQLFDGRSPGSRVAA
jgi:hypothetical protein